MSNYPDDIHQFANDPRSPFYDGPDYFDVHDDTEDELEDEDLQD